MNFAAWADLYFFRSSLSPTRNSISLKHTHSHTHFLAYIPKPCVGETESSNKKHHQIQILIPKQPIRHGSPSHGKATQRIQKY